MNLIKFITNSIFKQSLVHEQYITFYDILISLAPINETNISLEDLPIVILKLEQELLES